MKSMQMRSVAALIVAAIAGGSWSAQAQVALKDEARPADILLGQTDQGVVFTDSKGMTLYYGLSDLKAGVSSCTNDTVKQSQSAAADIYLYPVEKPQTCVGDNPPVVAKTAKAVGAFTVIDRPDGIKQWAYNNKPLYTSVKDRKPGDVNGGFGIKRFVTTSGAPAFAPMVLPPEVRVETLGVARLMTDQAGSSLYTYDLDSRGKSACTDSCENTWKPVIAPSLAKAQGDWTLVTRPDKSRQWAFKGKPVYTYVNDLTPRSTNGTGHSNWHVLLANPLPKLPSAFTTQLTGIGHRYADAQGKTVYMFMCVQTTRDGSGGGVFCDDPGDSSNWWRSTCGSYEKCADTWRPVVADKNATGNATWSVVTLPQPWAPVRAVSDSEPGLKVWAFKGRPVFTYKYEDEPGMIEGEDIGFLGPIHWNSIPAVDVQVNTVLAAQ